jgi:hypothetical protein
MAQSDDRLIAEINEYLDNAMKRGEPWIARWVAHGIVQSHRAGLADNEDAAFFERTSYANVRETVRKVINKRAGTNPEQTADQGQIVLPGFERDHLQDYYVVKRDGDEIGVPVTQLTDQELEQKAALYRSMGQACYAHADEIDRFRHWRREAG